jgi:hypothetical protein
VVEGRFIAGNESSVIDGHLVARETFSAGAALIARHASGVEERRLSSPSRVIS